jgi:hypothetical protein
MRDNAGRWFKSSVSEGGSMVSMTRTGERDHNTLCRLDDRLGHLHRIEPKGGQSLGNTLSVQLIDHSLGHLHQAGCVGD